MQPRESLTPEKLHLGSCMIHEEQENIRTSLAIQSQKSG